MRAKLDTRLARDAAVAQVAGRQHGVVSRAQLIECGMSRDAIASWVRKRRLHRLHRGVYAVGHAAPSLHRGWMAGVLACGEGAVLSHQSAVALWGFLKPFHGPIHVTSPSTSGKVSQRGIVLHRSPSLRRRGETTFRERIPVTSPRRTIEDLEGTIEPRLVRRARRQAEFVKFKLNLPSDRSRSDLERDFLRFLTRHGFPRPEVNVKLGRQNLSRARLTKQIKDAASVACSARERARTPICAGQMPSGPEPSSTTTRPRSSSSWGKRWVGVAS